MSALRFLRDLIFEHFGWKVLSLVIAVFIWVLVASEPELATFATVRLEYKNLPDDLEISSEPVGSISLELRGPSGELRGIGDGGIHPSITLDMSTVQPGERTFPINDRNVKLSRGVHLVRSIPSEVHFRFEKRAYRTIPVIVRLSGEGQNGYVVESQDVTPANLAIVGPASHVERMNDAVTDPIDISNLVGTYGFHVNAFVNDPYVRFTSSPSVAVTVTMKKK